MGVVSVTPRPLFTPGTHCTRGNINICGNFESTEKPGEKFHFYKKKKNSVCEKSKCQSKMSKVVLGVESVTSWWDCTRCIGISWPTRRTVASGTCLHGVACCGTGRPQCSVFDLQHPLLQLKQSISVGCRLFAIQRLCMAPKIIKIKSIKILVAKRDPSHISKIRNCLAVLGGTC
jgi:hypothetical protein